MAKKATNRCGPVAGIGARSKTGRWFVPGRALRMGMRARWPELEEVWGQRLWWYLGRWELERCWGGGEVGCCRCSRLVALEHLAHLYAEPRIASRWPRVRYWRYDLMVGRCGGCGEFVMGIGTMTHV